MPFYLFPWFSHDIESLERINHGILVLVILVYEKNSDCNKEVCHSVKNYRKTKDTMNKFTQVNSRVQSRWFTVNSAEASALDSRTKFWVRWIVGNWIVAESSKCLLSHFTSLNHTSVRLFNINISTIYLSSTYIWHSRYLLLLLSLSCPFLTTRCWHSHAWPTVIVVYWSCKNCCGYS